MSALPDGTDHRGSVALQSLLLARANEQAITAPRDWLLFADRTGVAAGLAERLRARGDRCTLVRAGAYAVESDTTSSIDPTSAGDYRRLIADLRTAGRNIQGVVHAWSLDAGPWISMSATELDEAQNYGAMSMMLLAQALVSASSAPRLWLLTRGAQEADALDDPLSPAQAPAWGMGKTLALEHPELHCVCVDLPPKSSEAEFDALAAELTKSGLESQVTLRNGERRVARLARVRRTSAVPLRPEQRKAGDSCLNHLVRLINFVVNPSDGDCRGRAKSRSQCRRPGSISRMCSTCSGCIPAILVRSVLNAPVVSLRLAPE